MGRSRRTCLLVLACDRVVPKADTKESASPTKATPSMDRGKTLEPLDPFLLTATTSRCA